MLNLSTVQVFVDFTLTLPFFALNTKNFSRTGMKIPLELISSLEILSILIYCIVYIIKYNVLYISILY